MALRFDVPQVQENPDGWGPCAVPEHMKDMPFAPFGKGDKIGKAADWTQAAFQKYPGRYGTGVNAVFNFFHNEEEDSFHLVDSRPAKTPRFGQRRFQQNRFQQRRDRDGKLQDRDGDQKGGKGKQQQQKKNMWQFGRDQQRQILYSSSVDIRPEWQVKEQIPFSSLVKLTCNVGEAEDVVRCGQLEYYDKSFDRITPKADKPLTKTKRAFRSVTTSDDPVIRRLAAEDKARVFCTDRILTTLMCVKSSVYSWDVMVTRIGDKLFLDKRDSSNLDLLTVNETAPDAIPEDKDNMNGVQQLALESTTINQNFSQAVIIQGGEKYTMDEPNPFITPGEEEELASVAYRYRRWVLNEDEKVSIVVRCELDGVISNKGEDQLMSIKALNEFDHRATDWRKKLDSQRGAVLAFETKNNKNKIAKWTAAAILAGADIMKLGYVTRVGPRDNTNHVILGTQGCKPKEFASQISLHLEQCWGIVRALVEMLLKLEDGKYLLVKDPNKELIRLYAIPEDAFETNYVDEPLPENEDVPAEPTPLKPDEAGEE